MKCNYCGKDIPQNVKNCPQCRAQVLDFEDNAASDLTDKPMVNAQEKPNNGLTLGIWALFFIYFSPIVAIILASFGLSEAKKSQEIAKDAKISQAVNTLAIVIASIIILGTIIKTIIIIYYGIHGEFLWKEAKQNL